MIDGAADAIVEAYGNMESGELYYFDEEGKGVNGEYEVDGKTVYFTDGKAFSGYKDEILESHGILKCAKDDFKEIASEDYISARVTDFGVEAMVSDRAKAKQKYSGALIEKTNLEEIMLFYVNREKKEWS